MQKFWTENERDVLYFYQNIVRPRFHGVVRSTQVVCPMNLWTFNALIFN